MLGVTHTRINELEAQVNALVAALVDKTTVHDNVCRELELAAILKDEKLTEMTQRLSQQELMLTEKVR